MATLAPLDEQRRSAAMATVTRLDPDTAWAAFMRRDRSWDGRVIGAVKTTGIYCKPSCPARRPKRETCRILTPSREEARAAGYRAVPALQARRGRPRPRGGRRGGQADRAAEEAPSLAELAAAVGYAPHHFQRIFKRDLGRVAGRICPRRFATAGPRQALKANGRVTDAVYDAGYQSPSSFYSDAKERLGMTPSAWRDGGRGETIRWTDFRQPARPDADRGDSQGHLPADLRRQRSVAAAAVPKCDDRQGRRRP